MQDIAARRAAFRRLHDYFFMLPNVVNTGEVRKLQSLGFKAVASTSHGLSLTLGKSDYSATIEETLANLETLAKASDLPVNADFEDGFANDAAGVAASVRPAGAGVCGLSIEDRTGGGGALAGRARCARWRRCQPRARPPLRNYLVGNPGLDATIEPLKAYSQAGADVLYAPGVSKAEEIKAMVEAVAPKPLNVILVSPGMRVDDTKSLGARRVSVGGFLETAAWAAFQSAAVSLSQGGALPASSFGWRSRLRSRRHPGRTTPARHGVARHAKSAEPGRKPQSFEFESKDRSEP
jgi:2-methylisocitrate lyase-like PEP mutase family enzyme